MLQSKLLIKQYILGAREGITDAISHYKSNLQFQP